MALSPEALGLMIFGRSYAPCSVFWEWERVRRVYSTEIIISRLQNKKFPNPVALIVKPANFWSMSRIKFLV